MSAGRKTRIRIVYSNLLGLVLLLSLLATMAVGGIWLAFHSPAFYTPLAFGILSTFLLVILLPRRTTGSLTGKTYDGWETVGHGGNHGTWNSQFYSVTVEGKKYLVPYRFWKRITADRQRVSVIWFDPRKPSAVAIIETLGVAPSDSLPS